MFVRNFVAALRDLTFWPSRGEGGTLGAAVVFFPVVGLLIGAATAEADQLAARAELPARALLAVLVLAALGGFENLRALALLADSLRFWRDRARVLEAMTAEQVRAPGLLLAAAVLAAKGWILWSPGPLQFWSLLFAPMLARWAMVVIAFSARRAREGSPGPRYDPGITFQEFGWASVFATGSMLVALDAVGLVAILGVAAVSVVLRLACHRWLGGITSTSLRAGGELAEIAALGLLALFRLR